MDTKKNYHTTTKIRVESSKKLTYLSDDLGLSKIATISLLVDIGQKLNKEMKGYIKLLSDPRLKIKLYFDEDQRQEIVF